MTDTAHTVARYFTITMILKRLFQAEKVYHVTLICTQTETIGSFGKNSVLDLPVCLVDKHVMTST